MRKRVTPLNEKMNTREKIAEHAVGHLYANECDIVCFQVL
jgi:hypothetical protein